MNGSQEHSAPAEMSPPVAWDWLLEKILHGYLALTIYAAYLNPVLRTSPESGVTLFRILLPGAMILVVGKLLLQPRTCRFVMFLAALILYSVAQLVWFRAVEDSFMLSYLVNILALVVYGFLVDTYIRRYGFERFWKHLYAWFVVMIILSVHQLLTGMQYPNAPYLEGVARIYFGQENDASVAIAAFIPFLFYSKRRFVVSLLLLAAALVVLYLNSTRVVLMAVAAYPAFVVATGVALWLRNRLNIPYVLSVSTLLFIVATFMFLFRDLPIPLPRNDATLNELLFRPIGEILSGTKMRDVITSVNVRVTLVIAGLEALTDTLGFGVGPGGSTYEVAQYYPTNFVRSLHSFPFQLWVEHGWFLIGSIVWFYITYRSPLSWPRFIAFVGFVLLMTSSATSGMVTNYYFFSCVVFAVHYFDRERRGMPLTALFGGGQVRPIDLTRPSSPRPPAG